MIDRTGNVLGTNFLPQHDFVDISLKASGQAQLFVQDWEIGKKRSKGEIATVNLRELVANHFEITTQCSMPWNKSKTMSANRTDLFQKCRATVDEWVIDPTPISLLPV